MDGSEPEKLRAEGMRASPMGCTPAFEIVVVTLPATNM